MPSEPRVLTSRRRSGSRRGLAQRSPKAGDGQGRLDPAGRFVLYVEGPRDRDLLRIWARRVAHDLARALEGCVVIMGGRQPVRAADHFEGIRSADPRATGLVVLDRDHHEETAGWPEGTALDLFTWPRRHIESYVLVPAAIRRAAGCAADDPRVDRVFDSHVPSEDGDRGFIDLDAKRLLASKGPLARELGRSLSTADIARCMRVDEVHGDIVDLFDRTRAALGLVRNEPEVVVRAKGR